MVVECGKCADPMVVVVVVLSCGLFPCLTTFGFVVVLSVSQLGYNLVSGTNDDET